MQSEPQKETLLTWSQIPYTQKRFNHTSTLYKHYLIMFGGMYESGIYSNDITVLNLTTNQIIKPQLMGTTPIARYAHSACPISENQILIFGGQCSMGVLNETATITIHSEEPTFLVEWKVIKTQGDEQLHRASHSAHVCNNKMFVFGGWDKLGQSSKQLWSLDLEGYLWENLKVKKDMAISGGLWDHCSILYKDKILIFGGYCDTQGHRTNDFWILSTDTLEWEKIGPIGNLPPARQGTAMAEVQGKIYLFGGRTSEEYTNDLFCYDIDERTWQFVQTKGDIPSTRRYHTLNSFRNKLIVIGGQYIDHNSSNIYSVSVSEKQEALPKSEVFQSKKVNSILKTVWNERSFPDVVFLLQEEQVPAHKSILSAGSKFFEAMFKSGMQESKAETITISDIKPATFKALLQFIYCNEVELDEELASDLLEISNKYRVEDLIEGCEEFLAKRITEENYVKLATIADLLDLKLLRKATLDFIMKNLHKVLKRDDISSLPKSIFICFMEKVNQKGLLNT